MIHFENTLGFPLTTNILETLQEDRELCSEALTALVNGMHGIVKGCLTPHSPTPTVTNGVVIYDGELMPFVGGIITENAKVYVVTQTTNDEFENGSVLPVISKRYATIGISTEGIPWSEFSQNRYMKDVRHKLDSLTTMLNELTQRVNTMIPIGLIAIWGRPAGEIPPGWEEYTDLRGRMPVGIYPNAGMNLEAAGLGLNQLNGTGGSYKHKLLASELPRINGGFQTISQQEVNGTGAVETSEGFNAMIGGSASNFKHKEATIQFGNGVAHNNMPPYRVVHFIKYVGFQD